MNCNCTNGCNQCASAQVTPQVFSCPGTQRVIRHQHIVKHHHDTVNEYDIIHEHEYTTRDVVREREVVKHHDYTPHTPNYCGEQCAPTMPPLNPCNNGCAVPYRNNFGRRW